MQAVEVASKDVVPANPEFLDETEDLTRLSFLNEPSILHNLRRRFTHDSIYTSAGSVLVAINPFRPVITEHPAMSPWPLLAAESTRWHAMALH